MPSAIIRPLRWITVPGDRIMNVGSVTPNPGSSL
jgi:hypothetical protein